ncbi:MAG: glycosyltransferase family 4 protein [Methanomassiliicoccales archaeon]|nr:glycosyltransferase family 4 protein [Methanomassiliicoccales archaeon]
MICPDSKSIYIRSLVRHLTKNGAEVRLVPWFGKQFPLSFLKLIKAKRDGFDILHLHWIPFNWYHLIAPVRKLCDNYGIKMVWTIHNLRPHKPQFGDDRDFIAMRYIADWADAGIVHCERTKREFQELYGDSLPLYVIPHGNFNEYVELRERNSARRRLGIPEEKIVLLMFPPNRWNKGIRTFIEVLKQLPSNYIGIMAGQCRDRAIKEYILRQEDTLKNRLIVNLNYVTPDKTHDYFAAADIFFMPYDDITTSGSVIHAMSYAKAIISTDKGNLNELVSNGINGYLCETPGEMIQVIKSIDVETAKKMGEMSRKIADGLDWDDIAVKTMQVYRSLDGN